MFNSSSCSPHLADISIECGKKSNNLYKLLIKLVLNKRLFPTFHHVTMSSLCNEGNLYDYCLTFTIHCILSGNILQVLNSICLKVEFILCWCKILSWFLQCNVWWWIKTVVSSQIQQIVLCLWYWWYACFLSCDNVTYFAFIKKNPTRCNNVSKFYYSIFVWSSTCFRRHTTHHQEPKTALAASGFSYVEGCWTCSWWALSGTTCLMTPLVFHTWKFVGRVAGGHCQAHTVPDNIHQLCVQQPSTYEKPEAASVVLGSWWWTVCRPKRVELHINME